MQHKVSQYTLSPSQSPFPTLSFLSSSPGVNNSALRTNTAGITASASTVPALFFLCGRFFITLAVDVDAAFSCSFPAVAVGLEGRRRWKGEKDDARVCARDRDVDVGGDLDVDEGG